MPITTTDFWNDLNKAIMDIETNPEPGDRDGIRQGTFFTLSELLDHYSGLWPQIRQDAIDDLARHAMLIQAENLRHAAGGHGIARGNWFRIVETVSLREVLDRAALDKATMHHILALVSDNSASKPVLRLRHHTERPFGKKPPPPLLYEDEDDDDDIPF
jgi:hypothetical protein